MCRNDIHFLMTTKTTQKLLLGLVAITVVFLAGSIDYAYANHGVGSGAWDHDNVDYDCLSSLNNLTFETGSGCTDFATAVNTWNNISGSKLVFDEVSSNEDMTVGAANLSGVFGQNSLHIEGGDILDSDILFNTDYTWGDKDSADWWKWWVDTDYISVATHESGHSVRMVHDSGSTLMKNGHNAGDVYRTPSAHDKSTVEDKYP